MFALNVTAAWKICIPYQPVMKGKMFILGFLIKLGLIINNMGGYCEYTMRQST